MQVITVVTNISADKKFNWRPQTAVVGSSMSAAVSKAVSGGMLVFLLAKSCFYCHQPQLRAHNSAPNAAREVHFVHSALHSCHIV